MLKNSEIKYEIIKSYKNPFTGRFLTIFDSFKDSKLAVLNSVYDILIFNIQTTECIHKISTIESNKIYCLKWISKSKLAIGFFYNIQIWDLDENSKKCLKNLSEVLENQNQKTTCKLFGENHGGLHPLGSGNLIYNS